MAWHFNKLAEVAEVVAEAIGDTLGAGFYVAGREWGDEDSLIFTIRQCGERTLCATYTLTISGADVAKAFYEGKPENVAANY